MGTPEQRDFVEKVGGFFEGAGHPRMAGRILGWLLICDPPHQSAGDLLEATGASKGSISTMSRFLMGLGLIEQVPVVSGRSRSYYRIKPDAWHQVNRQHMERVSQLRRLADEGLVLLEGAPPEQKGRLLETRDMYAFYERELPVLLERWDEVRGGRGYGGTTELPETGGAEDRGGRDVNEEDGQQLRREE